jgi:hypothetical protein
MMNKIKASIIQTSCKVVTNEDFTGRKLRIFNSIQGQGGKTAKTFGMQIFLITTLLGKSP